MGRARPASLAALLGTVPSASGQQRFILSLVCSLANAFERRPSASGNLSRTVPLHAGRAACSGATVWPSLVVALLLDGPQLGSRWTARHASVLADDPGSAAITLTSYGMVRRCRPPGHEPSRVVAMWKDASGELTEIGLEDGADAVLIATNVTVASCSTADRRRHVGSTSTLTLAGDLRSHAGAGRVGDERDRRASHGAGRRDHERPPVVIARSCRPLGGQPAIGRQDRALSRRRLPLIYQ